MLLAHVDGPQRRPSERSGPRNEAQACTTVDVKRASVQIRCGKHQKQKWRVGMTQTLLYLQTKSQTIIAAVTTTLCDSCRIHKTQDSPRPRPPHDGDQVSGTCLGHN